MLRHPLFRLHSVALREDVSMKCEVASSRACMRVCIRCHLTPDNEYGLKKSSASNFFKRLRTKIRKAIITLQMHNASFNH